MSSATEPAKRMQIKVSEVSQESAIAHALNQATVELVLEAYSAACKRALSENMIVEVLRDVRLQLEPYFDARNNKSRKRLAVNSERSRLNRSKPSTPIEQEDERATERLTELLDS